MELRSVGIGIALALALGSAPARDFLVEDGDVSGLQEAIRVASETPGPDRILLSRGARFVFHAPAAGARTALPPVVGTIDLIGNGAELRRYAEAPFAHLQVVEGASLRLVDVTLADGGAGAIVNDGALFAWGAIIEDSSAEAGASALLNRGSARLLDCDIRFNSYAGAASSGGAIVNHGELSLTDSRVHGNTAFGGSEPAEFGAALSNHGRARLVGVTISGNGAPAAFGRSGAIANFAGGELEIRDSVIAGNEPAPLAAVRTGGVLALSGTRIGH